MKKKLKEFGLYRNKNSVFVIAEAGVNHNGRLDLALKLVKAAAKAGADAVKFQDFKAETISTDRALAASYQKRNTEKILFQKKLLSKIEFNPAWYPKIVSECKKQKIEFMSTPHGGKASVKILNKYVRIWKVGSGDLLNFILLSEIAKTKKPVILSTGMHNMREVQKSVRYLKLKGYKNSMISVLHCTTDYPCSLQDVNLKAMITMRDKLKGVTVGYSDHTIGYQVAVMAVTLGANIYECHFTLDRLLPGPDHKASSEPNELASKIKMVRNVNIILGNGKKVPNESELRDMRPKVTKSIVAIQNLKKGHRLTENDFEAKRPGDGLSPEKYEMLLGKKIKKDILCDTQILLKDLEH